MLQGQEKRVKKNCKAFACPLAEFSFILIGLFEKSLENHPFKEVDHNLPALDKIAARYMMVMTWLYKYAGSVPRSLVVHKSAVDV